MDIQDFRTDYYLFNPKPYGRIFVFVDFGNVRKWAKSLWSKENKKDLNNEIDIKKLAEMCDWIKPNKKYFYYGHYKNDPKSIFRIDKARKSGFKIRTKEVKLIDEFNEDGKFMGKKSKCNFDTEMTMDMILKMPRYDTVFLLSGDSDFHFLLSYLKSKGKKIIVMCVRDYISKELYDNCEFIPADPLKNFLEYLPKNKTLPAKGREA